MKDNPESLMLPEELSLNLAKIYDQYQRIISCLLNKHSGKKKSGIADLGGMSNAFFEVMAKIYSRPEKLLEKQLEYYSEYMKLFEETSSAFVRGSKENFHPNSYKNIDQRFKDEMWGNNVFFDLIRKSYLMTSDWVQKLVENVEDVEPRKVIKARFITRQFLDAMSPTNFVFTNPKILKATIESNCSNLVKGMSRMLEDIERSGNLIDISTNDVRAFEIGKNLATTEGKVIYQNDIIQLIHYKALTKSQYSVPLLIVPPCINKYYILDLKPENSFVRWLLEQGHNVFMISWVNPGKELGHKTFADYMLEGPVEAAKQIISFTGAISVNAAGYCLGGTLLVSAVAYLKKLNSNIFNSVTTIASLIDFADAGELSVFIDDAQLELIEKQVREVGYFDGDDMSMAFSLLRANDMIWGCFVRNYLLGQDLMPFDLLYWNSDTTRLPFEMHMFYLRNMYNSNLLVKPGGISLNGVEIDVSLVDVPCYVLATKDDHIAPWVSTFAGTRVLAGNTRFVLGGSGHVAGVVNHPDSGKYCYWVGDTECDVAEEWFCSAIKHDGSWWLDWITWLDKTSGDKAKFVVKDFEYIEDAPGSYVIVK